MTEQTDSPARKAREATRAKAPAKRAPRGQAKTEAAAEDTARELSAAGAGASGRSDTSENMEQMWDVGRIGPMMITEPMTMESLSVHQLWCMVMESVKSVAKGDYNKDQHFHFRGIDATMDAVGPALRRMGVHVRPRRVELISSTEYTTRNATRMLNRVVKVEWEVTGPLGDSFIGESMGEAADAGDKSLTKAQSVAYRVFLLNALTIPTGDADPDAESHERATPSERQQAVAQASQRTYASREEFERERQAQAQQRAGEENQGAGQEQAGEENQAAQNIQAAARSEMWRVAKSLGWQWGPLAARFKSDHGVASEFADAATIEKFTALLLKEAEAEEDAAKANAAEVLGAKEVQPDEAQSGPLL